MTKEKKKKKKFTSGKAPRELWLHSLQEDAVPLNRKSGGVGIRSEMEYWTNSLRRSTDHSDARPNESFTGLRNIHEIDVPYYSTSQYLRQVVGSEDNSYGVAIEMDQQSLRPGPAGSASYKSPEEYFDEVIRLKKEMNDITTANEISKTKCRRLEFENTKKDKLLKQILNPSKSDEFRRGLTDSSLAVEKLKQKVLQLEFQLKEKDAEFITIQNDMRYTRIEEMRLQLEVLYSEVTRLRTCGPAERQYARDLEQTFQKLEKEDGMEEEPEPQKRPVEVIEDVQAGRAVAPSRETVNALTRSLKKQNEEKTKLAIENKSLKKDLQRFMEAKDTKETVAKEYEDMTRKQLLKAITRLEQRMKNEKEDLITGPTGRRVRDVDTSIKISVEGTPEQRLDALDKRETELLGTIDQSNKAVERLKADRQYYREKYEAKCKEVDDRDAMIKRMKRDGGRSPSLDGRITPTGSGKRPSSGRERPGSSYGRRGGASPRGSEAETAKSQHAAEVIQRFWRKKHGDVEEDIDWGVVMVQSALRGYRARQKFLSKQHGRGSISGSVYGQARSQRESRDSFDRSSRFSDDRSTPDEGSDDEITLLQSVIRGNSARSQHQGPRLPSYGVTPFERGFTGRESPGLSIPEDDSTSMGSARSLDRPSAPRPLDRPTSAKGRRSTSSRVVGREGLHYGRRHSVIREEDGDDDF